MVGKLGRYNLPLVVVEWGRVVLCSPFPGRYCGQLSLDDLNTWCGQCAQMCPICPQLKHLILFCVASTSPTPLLTAKATVYSREVTFEQASTI